MSKNPTLSRGINLSSEPCFKKTFPAVCWGLIPIPSLVMMALVAAGTLNLKKIHLKDENFNFFGCLNNELTSSAANLSTAVNGVLSGTLKLNKIKALLLSNVSIKTSLNMLTLYKKV